MSSRPIVPTAERVAPVTSPRRFIIVVPVADRPRHIRACLGSLRTLLQRHPYRGEIVVLIADDSADPAHVADTATVVAEQTAAGFTGARVIHFTPAEQAALVAALAARSDAFTRVLGPAPAGHYGHKGQGTMRNIAYLKVAQLLKTWPAAPTLIWSLDSDQEFQVKLATPEGDREDYVVDFFNALDRIFARTDAQVLTGKVVGDPPVSPAVMTANFIEDVIGFLSQVRELSPQAACGHHAAAAHRGGDAAYHDMAELFGFQPEAVYRYRCPLPGAHDEAAGFHHFAARLNSFFYGEHPTRVSYYVPDDARGVLGGVQPARTVYAGNYVFRAEALNHFIPFAALRLRMSGPTLGRLLKAELGARFVSANLPMLHKRTVTSGGQSEFRPGIETRREATPGTCPRATASTTPARDRDTSVPPVIDMSGEFERQFYGDVMLFSVEQLAAQGRLASAEFVATTLDERRATLLDKYNARQQGILRRIGVLESLLESPAAWWHAPEHASSIAAFKTFIENVRRNFSPDSTGHVRINDPVLWQQWRERLREAIVTYPADRLAWEQLLCAP